MRIYFLRHTTLDIEDNIFYGQTDVDVSSNFINEVKIIKKKIEGEDLNLKKTLVISSPLKRCVKLATALNVSFKIDPRIKELDLGDWEMKLMSSIEKSEIEKWQDNLMEYKVPNGESNKNFLKRLNGFLKDILKFKQDVLLVAHAGSINGMISILTKEPFDKLVKNYWEKIKHGSLTSIKLNEKKVIIEYIGK
ncbi:MAG: histidine phosphatase family protein [Alphaproteobacteria bacterium]|jgi:alpha-ribazole phosphatase